MIPAFVPADIVDTVPMSDNVCTLSYKAPELLLGGLSYGKSVDIWSAGIIYYELKSVRGGMPFRTHSQIETLLVIFLHLGTPTSDSWAGISWFTGLCIKCFMLAYVCMLNRIPIAAILQLQVSKVWGKHFVPLPPPAGIIPPLADILNHACADFFVWCRICSSWIRTSVSRPPRPCADTSKRTLCHHNSI